MACTLSEPRAAINNAKRSAGACVGVCNRVNLFSINARYGAYSGTVGMYVLEKMTVPQKGGFEAAVMIIILLLLLRYSD
jgi:hypothetical protein